MVRLKASKEKTAELESVKQGMESRQNQLLELEQCLPKPNGTYLKIILGNVNVSILDKMDK